MKLTLKSNQKDIKVILKVNNFIHNENIDLNYKSYILDYTNGYLYGYVNLSV